METGGTAAIDRAGFFKLIDRTKDVINSGGERNSPVALERSTSRLCGETPGSGSC
jgi:acyl-coenzyme A synthetase/AMP-(fatty) acid ligase